jgi:ketosteroid isomerase-like protein
MSQESVEVLRRGIDAWNRGDLAATLALLSHEFEFRPAPDFFDLDAVYRGHEGWTRFWEVWRDAWESVTIRIDRMEDLGDRVLAIVTFDGIGRGSGVRASITYGQIWTIRDGLALRCEVLHPEEALESAGLRE